MHERSPLRVLAGGFVILVVVVCFVAQMLQGECPVP